MQAREVVQLRENNLPPKTASEGYKWLRTADVPDPKRGFER